MANIDFPLINQREKIPQFAIKAAVQQIVDIFKPEKVILFGSYAHDKPKPESDVDILVVMNTPIKETEQAIQICQEIDYHFGLDLIVRTPEKVDHRLALGDPFMIKIMEEGKILYERTNG